MSEGMSRRAALGTVFTVGAGGVIGAFRGWGGVEAAERRPNALAGAINQEIREGVREMTRRPGPGARRFAGGLRVFAANAQAQGLDEKVAEYYGNLVQQQGRDALVFSEPNWAAVADEARLLGIDRFTPPTFDPKLRAESVDAMLAGQFTSVLAQAATQLEAMSLRMDRRGVPGIRGVVFGGAACIRTMEMENWASTAMKITCAATGLFFIEAPICAEATGIFLGIWLANELEGCH